MTTKQKTIKLTKTETNALLRAYRANTKGSYVFYGSSVAAKTLGKMVTEQQMLVYKGGNNYGITDAGRAYIDQHFPLEAIRWFSELIQAWLVSEHNKAHEQRENDKQAALRAELGIPVDYPRMTIQNIGYVDKCYIIDFSSGVAIRQNANGWYVRMQGANDIDRDKAQDIIEDLITALNIIKHYLPKKDTE
jgi:hypothetical protein